MEDGKGIQVPGSESPSPAPVPANHALDAPLGVMP